MNDVFFFYIIDKATQEKGGTTFPETLCECLCLATRKCYRQVFKY